MKGALRKATYFPTGTPYRQKVLRSPSLPGRERRAAEQVYPRTSASGGSAWINLREHHNETFTGFYDPKVRVWMFEYIKTQSGAVSKNGMSAGGRLSDCLNAHPRCIATALFSLCITPDTPLLYVGTETGMRK